MRKLANVLLGVTMFGGAVMAQPAAPTTPGEADIAAPQRATLSSQDMLTQGRKHRTQMDETAQRVQQRVEGARKQRDIIRVNCLLDKVAQLRANLNIADEALATLQDAISRRDEGGSLHEYTRLTILNQKVQVLDAEAEACVGEDLSFVGATRVDVEVSGVPEGDFTHPAIPEPTYTRPPAASPSL